jgi:hypothetical protein
LLPLPVFLRRRFLRRTRRFLAIAREAAGVQDEEDGDEHVLGIDGFIRRVGAAVAEAGRRERWAEAVVFLELRRWHASR